MEERLCLTSASRDAVSLLCLSHVLGSNIDSAPCKEKLIPFSHENLPATRTSSRISVPGDCPAPVTDKYIFKI